MIFNSLEDSTPPRSKPLLIVSEYTSAMPYMPYTIGWYNGYEFRSHDIEGVIYNVLHWAELPSENIPHSKYEVHAMEMKKIELSYEQKIIRRFLRWAIEHQLVTGDTNGKPFYIKSNETEEFLTTEEVLDRCLIK